MYSTPTTGDYNNSLLTHSMGSIMAHGGKEFVLLVQAPIIAQ
jgi:hypothetical protein